MSEQDPGSSVIDQQLVNNTERFLGQPTEVPFQGIEYNIPEADRERWNPGVIDSNGGLVAAHDADRPVIHIAPASDRDIFKGYTAGSANVPLSGGDQDGWPGGKYSRDVAKMGLNEVARKKGVMGRTIPTPDGKYTMFTSDPFDKGDFIDMSGVTETTSQGVEVRHSSDLVTEIASPKSDINSKDIVKVGTFNTNNGTLSWVTPEGKTQIAPDSAERVARLKELGYDMSEVLDVSHSNGESFAPGQSGDPAQEYAEIQFGDMKRAGETMTLDERNSIFGSITVPSEYLSLVKN